MKTLVVLYGAENLLCCYLEDFALTPSKGLRLFFNGKRYDVAEVLEYLGNRGMDGKVLTGYDKFVQMLPLLSEDGIDAATAAVIFDKMIPVGKDELPGITTSGKILVKQSVAKPLEFDHIIFIHLKEHSSEEMPKLTLLSRSSFAAGSGNKKKRGNRRSGSGSGSSSGAKARSKKT